MDDRALDLGYLPGVQRGSPERAHVEDIDHPASQCVDLGDVDVEVEVGETRRDGVEQPESIRGAHFEDRRVLGGAFDKSDLGDERGRRPVLARLSLNVRFHRQPTRVCGAEVVFERRPRRRRCLHDEALER